MKPPANPWKIQSRNTVFENKWLTIYQDVAAGPLNKNYDYGVVHFKNLAVGVLPIDNKGNTWLVGQWRYPLNAYSWEIPEGGCLLDTGEQPPEAAARELKEETGLEASYYQVLLEMDLSNSVTDEKAIVYLATGLTEGQNKPEDSEDLKIRKLKITEALDMVISGEIKDAISVAALLRYYYLSQQ